MRFVAGSTGTRRSIGAQNLAEQRLLKGWNLSHLSTSDHPSKETAPQKNGVVGRHLKIGDGQDWQRKVKDVVGRQHWSEDGEIEHEHLCNVRKATEGKKNTSNPRRMATTIALHHVHSREKKGYDWQHGKAHHIANVGVFPEPWATDQHATTHPMPSFLPLGWMHATISIQRHLDKSRQLNWPTFKETGRT